MAAIDQESRDCDSGPVYNVDSAALKKFRAKARKGLMSLPREERRAYAEAVEAAVRARVAITKSTPRAANCASGTFLSNGRDISKAVREQNRRAQNAAALRDRTGRTPDQWKFLYEQAMKEKRAAQ